MGKVLFFVLIGVIVWLLFFAKRMGAGRRKGRDIDGRVNGSGDGAAPPRSIAPEQMHQCSSCGVHLPMSEACALAGQRGKYSCADPDNCANRPR